jgi:RimJ/RimL family protein N-acetyltransferase
VSALLGREDDHALLAYFESSPDETIWMRVAHHTGGARFAAARAQGGLTALAALDRDGLLHVHATAPSAELLQTCVREGPVVGVAGTEEQVEAAIRALGFERRPIARVSRELIMAADLDALVVPEVLARGELSARRARPADLPLLREWRARYFEEVHRLEADEELLAEVASDQAEGRLWVVEAGGEIVNTVAFSAVFPTLVQVEYSYSPPELRAKKYGRSALVGALLAARAEGVRRAVLNTDEKNFGVHNAVEPCGFRRIANYQVVVFAG